MTRFCICVDCDSPQMMNQFGRCTKCGSNATMIIGNNYVKNMRFMRNKVSRGKRNNLLILLPKVQKGNS